jgi:hypothetical protein
MAIFEDDYQSTNEDQAITDSPQLNILGEPQPPTHYTSVAVPIPSTDQEPPDIPASSILQHGVHLLPPASAPPAFSQIRQEPLINEVIQYLLENKILIPYSNIKCAFPLLLVSKPSGAAGTVLDMSPWTTYYDPAHIQLYSAAEVLSTIPLQSQMIKMGLKSGFF